MSEPTYLINKWVLKCRVRVYIVNSKTLVKLIIMGDEEKKSKKKKDDYTEIEFELGELEFEAKGKSAVVERMFRLLLEKLETGSLSAITSKVRELEEIVEGEEEEEEEEEEEKSEDSEQPEDPKEEPSTDDAEADLSETALPEDVSHSPPSWEALDTEEPPESDAERESREIE